MIEIVNFFQARALNGFLRSYVETWILNTWYFCITLRSAGSQKGILLLSRLRSAQSFAHNCQITQPLRMYRCFKEELSHNRYKNSQFGFGVSVCYCYVKIEKYHNQI